MLTVFLLLWVLYCRLSGFHVLCAFVWLILGLVNLVDFGGYVSLDLSTGLWECGFWWICCDFCSCVGLV